MKLTGTLSVLALSVLLLLSGCAMPDGAAETHRPAVTPTLPPTTARSLADFPLRKDATWVYTHWGYDVYGEGTWRVVQSVVETGFHQGLYYARLESTAEVLEGTPDAGFITAPETGSFWYLVDGSALYRGTGPLPEVLSNAWLDLVLPLDTVEDGWYPDPEQRRLFDGEDLRLPGFRWVSPPTTKNVVTGETAPCYEVITSYNNGGVYSEFCEGIGFVFRKFDHSGTSYGYEVTLSAFSVP